MGFEMRDAFVRREECKAAWESEVEFAEMARVLKSLAAEFGQEATPAIDELAHHGIGAALGVLANQTGADVESDYLRCRARQRLAPDPLQYEIRTTGSGSSRQEETGASVQSRFGRSQRSIVGRSMPRRTA